MSKSLNQQSSKIPTTDAKKMVECGVYERFGIIGVNEENRIVVNSCGIILKHPKHGLNYYYKEGDAYGNFEEYDKLALSYGELMSEYEGKFAMKKF